VNRSKKLMYVVAGGAGVLALQLAFHLAGPSALASSHEEHPAEHPTAAEHGQSHIVLAPFAEGKAEAWQAWATEWASDEEGVVAFNKRHGLTRQAGWLCQTPGGPMVVVLHEGPGSATLMQTMAESDDPYDVKMVAQLSELHGVDFSGEMPPAPAIVFDTSQEGSWVPGSEHPTEHPE
jgi:hypothetical protein